MCNSKFEDSFNVSSEGSVKLRTKFTKNFPDSQVQKNVIRVIEDLNMLSVCDIFKFLIKASARKDYLVQVVHLEQTELTPEQTKIIWNEIRSQVNSSFKLFPCADTFDEISDPFTAVWEDTSFDIAVNLLKSVVKYLDSHNIAEIQRVLFLLSSDLSNHNFGGIRELGHSYEEAAKLSKFSYQAYCLMNALCANYIYFSILPLLPYLSENSQLNTSEVETSKSCDFEEPATAYDATTPEDSSVEDEPTPSVTPVAKNEPAKEKVKLTLNEISDFIENFKLFSDFFVAVGGLRELNVSPQFLLDNEDEFMKLIDTIDSNFKKR